MIKLILASTVIVGLVLALLTWIDAQGLQGQLLFMLVMTLVVILLLPGMMFTTGAGFAFGVIEGLIVVVLGTTLVATGAFLLARYGLGERAEARVQRHARLKAIFASTLPLKPCRGGCTPKQIRRSRGQPWSATRLGQATVLTTLPRVKTLIRVMALRCRRAETTQTTMEARS